MSWSAKDEVITESRTPSDMARTKQGKRKSVAGEFHWSQCSQACAVSEHVGEDVEAVQGVPPSEIHRESDEGVGRNE